MGTSFVLARNQAGAGVGPTAEAWGVLLELQVCWLVLTGSFLLCISFDSTCSRHSAVL